MKHFEKGAIDELILRLTGYEGKHGHGHYHHDEVEKGFKFEKEILQEDRLRLTRELRSIEEDKDWMNKEMKRIEERLKKI
ncbi:MAG: hypothetical protein ACP5PA_03630 [Elusimicrobiales bacterium]